MARPIGRFHKNTSLLRNLISRLQLPMDMKGLEGCSATNEWLGKAMNCSSRQVCRYLEDLKKRSMVIVFSKKCYSAVRGFYCIRRITITNEEIERKRHLGMLNSWLSDPKSENYMMQCPEATFKALSDNVKLVDKAYNATKTPSECMRTFLLLMQPELQVILDRVRN